MGEPQTYMPLISLDKDAGVLEFEIETEGLKISFDMDVERIPELISKLEDLQERYNQDE